jgi:hypothetical protein
MKHNQNAFISLTTKAAPGSPTPGPSQLTDKGKGKETATATATDSTGDVPGPSRLTDKGKGKATAVATATDGTGDVPENEEMAGVDDADYDNSGMADVNMEDAGGASGSGGERVPVSTMDSLVGAGAATGSTPQSLLQQMRLNLPTLQETSE